MNISLINMEGNYGLIDAEKFTCIGYNIIKFPSSTYFHKWDLSIDGPVISSVEVVCEGTYILESTSILTIMFYKNEFNETIEYLRTINNVNVNVIYYYSKNDALFFLRSIWQKY